MWAYYKPDEVHIEGDASATYVWGNKTLSYHRCKTCGCMTHYTVVGGGEEPRVAVNCRMLEREEWDRLESEQSEGE